MINNDSTLIRSVPYLKLPKEYEHLANKLIEQSDMPIVFWIDAELPNNYRCRHPLQKNQFWVTIKPNCDENEKLRLILGGIYGAVQEQRRYWRAGIQPEYEAELKSHSNHEHLEAYYDFLSRLGNIITTLDVEWFLSTYGIHTARRIRKYFFRDRKNRLKEYINLHKPRLTKPYITWYREVEVINLIECGNYYRLGEDYRRDLKKLLNQIDMSYLSEVEWVANLINTIQKDHNSTNGAELTERFLNAIIEHFGLDHMVRLCKYEAYSGSYPIGDEDEADVLSYILNTLPRQNDLINWIRIAREFVCVNREAMDYSSPDITMNLIHTDLCNAYADGNRSSGYSISYTTGQIYKLTDTVKNWKLSENLSSLVILIGESEVRRNLLRQVIFYVTAHEYAHIINGDCDRSFQKSTEGLSFSSYEREEIERNANRIAKQLLHQALPFLYRFPPAPTGEFERMDIALRKGGMGALKRSITTSRSEEIKREVSDFQFKLIRDQLLSSEADLIINRLQLETD